MRKFGLSGLACTLALSVTACGSGASDDGNSTVESASAEKTQTAPAADPCSFVSKEDVSAATGETILETEASEGSCKYLTDDADAAFVQVDIKQSGGADEMQTARSAAGALGEIGAEMKGAGGAEGHTGALLTESGAAPAIGDQAFFGPNQQLSVLKGDSYFAVSPPQMRSRMSSGGNPLLSADKKRGMAAAVAQKIVLKL